MNINVGCGAYPAPGWLNLDVQHPDADRVHDATEGLPEDIDVPIERIYAGHVLEHLEKDQVVAMLKLWRDHPQVTERTHMAVVGPDCDEALRWFKRGDLTLQEYEDMVGNQNPTPGESHLWRSTGVETMDLLREAGWEARFLDLGSLSLDGWPLTSQIGWQFALLCRTAK